MNTKNLTKKQLVDKIYSLIQSNLDLYTDKGYNFHSCYMGELEVWEDYKPRTESITVYNYCEMQIKGKYVTGEIIKALDYPKYILLDWLEFETNKILNARK